VLLAAGQAKAGAEVHVGMLTGGPNEEALSASGVGVHQVESRGNHDPRVALRLARLVRRMRPDVVQTWLAQMDVLGGFAAIAAGVPWVMTERASAAAYSPSVKTRLRRWMAGRARVIVANSRGGAEYWTSARPSVRTVVIPNALAIEAIDASPPAVGELSLGISNSPIVLSAGRFSGEKNFPVLVAAFRRLLDVHPATLLLCGEGPTRPSIERLISIEGLASNVRLPGYRDDLWSLMKNAAVFASTSTFEGHPNAVLEAMACGCPLVVSDIPAHREFLDETCALFVSGDDADGIARALREVLTNRDESWRRAERARERVLAFSIQRAVAAYERVYGAEIAVETRAARPLIGSE
jgi:glycosyltransferase involved in cell wall biosynthesis